MELFKLCNNKVRFRSEGINRHWKKSANLAAHKPKAILLKVLMIKEFIVRVVETHGYRNNQTYSLSGDTTFEDSSFFSCIFLTVVSLLELVTI